MKRIRRTFAALFLTGALLWTTALPATASTPQLAKQVFGTMSVEVYDAENTATSIKHTSAGTYFLDGANNSLGRATTGRTYAQDVTGPVDAAHDFWNNLQATGTYSPDNTRYDSLRDDLIALDAFNDYRGVQRSNSSHSSSYLAGQSNPSAASSSPASSLSYSEAETYAREVLRLVNRERVKAGLNEVEWDEDFFRCAQIRAEEMSRLFGHTRPDPVHTGRDWPRNVNGRGYYNAPSVADELGIPYTWIMENAGAGYSSPEAVVKGWMKSSGHRANILRESHGRGAAGVYISSENTAAGYKTYWALWLDE